jgi:hypothetical protein
MERRHYELIAAVIKTQRANYHVDLTGDPATLGAIDDIALRFAEALAQCNSGFDRARFLKACGVAS